jgi:NADH-quinone oxidoreductase subunit C
MTPILQQVAAQLAALAGGSATVTAPLGAGAPGGSAGEASSERTACAEVGFAAKGYHLDAQVAVEQVVAAAEIMDRNGFSLDTMTGVDWLAQNEMEVVYDYFHPAAPWRVVVRTRTSRARTEIPTISGVFPGANWHEREAHDFFGIVFSGHPQLEPLLLPEDATYHPLRKDFQA